MLPNGPGRSVLRLTLLVVALVAGIIFVLHSFGAKESRVRAAERDLQKAELERRATAVHATAAVARAAEARAATKPALARAESLHSRVRLERTGQLRLRDTGAPEGTLVPMPPLVTERIQADSAAISALSLALTWDSRAAEAQEDRFAADLKVRDAARITIAALEDERRPKCGRRCGIVLGAASVVALSIAVDQARRLVHP
jgi:hypothetical protein